MAKYAQLVATGLPHGVLLTIKNAAGNQVSNLFPEANSNGPDNRPRYADGNGSISPDVYLPNGTYTVAYSGGSQSVTVSGATGLPAASVYVDPATQAELDQAATDARGTYEQTVVLQGPGIDPTGATDSAAAIQALLTSMTGGGKAVPPKGATLRSDVQLSLPANVQIVGTRGETLSFPSGSNGFKFYDHARVVGVRVVGNGGSTSRAGEVENTTTRGAAGFVNCAIDNWGFGSHLGITVDGGCPDGYIYTLNDVTRCFAASLYATRANNSLVTLNRITQPNSGRAIQFLGGSGNHVTDNPKISGGIAGIIFLFQRSVTGAAGCFERNVVTGNAVDGFLEEGISFDCNGNSAADSGAIDYDTVASATGSTVTLASASWVGAGAIHSGYRMAFVTGTLKGRCFRITAQANAVFTIDASAAEIALITAGDGVSILAAAMNNVVAGNVVDARSGGTAIMFWGGAFGNSVTGNSCMGKNIRIASLNGLVASSASRLGVVGRAPSGHNTVTGNTVTGADIQFDYTNYGGATDFYSYGNVVSGNGIPNGRVRIDRHQDLRAGNSCGFADVLVNTPSDGRRPGNGTHQRIGDPRPQVGEYVMGGATTVGTFASPDGQLRLHPMWLAAGTYDQVAFSTSVVGSAGSVCRVVAYSDKDGLPDALLIDSGTVDTASTAGTKTITSSSWVTPAAASFTTSGEVIWIGVVNQGAPTTPATVRIINNEGIQLVQSALDFTLTAVSRQMTGVTAAPPATASAMTLTNGPHRVALRRSA